MQDSPAPATPDGPRALARPEPSDGESPRERAVTRALTLLGCVATEPDAGGVLFLDLDPELLPALGSWLARHMGAGRDVHTLGSWLGEDELWLRPRLDDRGLRLVPGLLVEKPGEPPPVVLVPDLAQAGPAVVRAAVTLIGADVGHVEMHDHSLRWHPRARWLAAVDRAEAPRLSPHLLDRFPLRVEAEHLNDALWSLGTERFWDLPAERESLVSALPLLPYVPEDGPRPLLTPGAGHRVAAMVAGVAGMRRGLALARTARALAAHAGARRTEVRHVMAAADLLGIPLPRPSLDPLLPEPHAGSHPTVVPPMGPEPPPPEVSYAPGLAVEPEPPLALPETAVTPRAAKEPAPYPEDSPDALPQLGSLRPPNRRRTVAKRLNGRPVGTMRARDVHDLALVPSLVEAAKTRVLDKSLRTGPLTLRAKDLRQYRRRPEPAHALVLVLDHSCRDWDHSAALAPHLRWAYESNAAVTVVEFGHSGAELELCAERFRAPSLLHPGLLEALERAPGTASPLAHALDLGVHELRRFLRRGRAVVDEVLFVVVTDGRGNVPLDASLRGRPPSGVHREGVDDALYVAATAAPLNRMRAVVIAPDLDHYAELPAELAEALGATLVVTPRSRPGARR
ncbi:hypothetical protein BN159_4012 [Streptomyces davaonensis JCM 4913]|uniref:Magnesium chelatase n=1 Tax=Streptomyces davaonensis (strain DSM 101723 / JCM 4913 / KCC S-0913 / 768) TaxID=1214101 RepID=K4QWF0_STRDJ|nr:hypothetical protein [Streptomyces davaonensis]CCK28391.1 hypothetical protein BN159_4012 [Streptomyces davaonensis JCM 4913]